MTLPIAEPSPAIARRKRLPSRQAFDALLYVHGARSGSLPRTLPESSRWQSLHGREKPAAGTVRSMTMADAGQCSAVLGYADAGAGMFERRLLAGKLVQEIAARRPERVALIVDPALPSRETWFDALLGALLARSFALPSFRRERSARWMPRRIELIDAPPVPLARIQATAAANNLARWLTALPPNRLDAGAYRKALQQLARRHRLQLRWYGERDLKRLGAGAFLAVARGNAARTAGIASLRWRGRRSRDTDVSLVGKGILFDTGGTNLKPHRSMLDMHTDMAGSAVALASLVALARLRAPVNAEAWLAISENNIGPTAYRPQEIVRALNGTTIQVIHTDAEGRMVLADTLSLAARSRPALMIDYATLTGACVHALTERYSGVFTNRPALHELLREAGTASGERVWPFPIDADFDTDIDSRIADVRQCAVEGKGDHILAARFLQRFVPAATPWVHMDLSAAMRHGGLADLDTDITGFGVRYTLQLLLAHDWRGGVRKA